MFEIFSKLILETLVCEICSKLLAVKNKDTKTMSEICLKPSV